MSYKEDNDARDALRYAAARKDFGPLGLSAMKAAAAAMALGEPDIELLYPEDAALVRRIQSDLLAFSRLLEQAK